MDIACLCGNSGLLDTWKAGEFPEAPMAITNTSVTWQATTFTERRIYYAFLNPSLFTQLPPNNGRCGKGGPNRGDWLYIWQWLG